MDTTDLKILSLLDAAVGTQSCQTRFAGREPGAFEIILKAAQVSLDLAGHLAIGTARAEKVRQAGKEPSHRLSPLF